MRHIVDGYNVTMADDATRPLPREAQRGALVSRLALHWRELLGPGDVVIVFDGRHGLAHASPVPGLEVLFAKGETADDLIVRLAASSAGALTVVTSDRELRDRVRGAAPDVQVTFKGASSLFEATARREARDGRRRRGRIGGSTAGLPKGANLITEELKGIWLQEDDG